MKLKHFTVLIFVMILIGCDSNEPKNQANINQKTPDVEVVSQKQELQKDPAIVTVTKNIGSNELGITTSSLRSKPNPLGEGTFVYVPKTRFNGVERKIIWIVIDDQVFPLNGATKGSLTPNLSWPREAPKNLWSRTGLDPYMASDAINLVFGVN